MSAIKQYTQHLSSNVNKIRTFREYCFKRASVQCILYETERSPVAIPCAPDYHKRRERENVCTRKRERENAREMFIHPRLLLSFQGLSANQKIKKKKFH